MDHRGAFWRRGLRDPYTRNRPFRGLLDLLRGVRSSRSGWVLPMAALAVGAATDRDHGVESQN